VRKDAAITTSLSLLFISFKIIFSVIQYSFSDLGGKRGKKKILTERSDVKV
jgi:hypothetical protein